MISASHKAALAQRIVLVLLAALLFLGRLPRAARAAAPDPSRIVALGPAQLEQRLRPGGSALLDVPARIADGWHINSNHPNGDYYIPTRLKIAPPANVSAGPVIYPQAQIATLSFAGREKLSVFTGAIEFKVPLTAGVGWRGDIGQPALIEIDFQACNDSQCLRPMSVKQTIDLAGVLTPARAYGAAARMGDLAEAEAPGAADEGAIAAVFAQHGYFLGFLAVLLGGLALNLTPCVYPLVGVTVAYFGNEGGGPRKVVGLAALYVIGIALMFSGVGVAVALSGGLFGEALQNPWVLGTIAAMLLVLAASSFGLFSLQPPQFLMRRAGAARPGYAGALVMGLGMGVVAAPCIGPIVLGLLLMVQRSGSALLGFGLFFTLAVGLGLPYVGLALAAGSIRRLPRSGEWLAWVEQLFGFVLAGLALYFLDPLVPHRLITRLLPFYASGAGIYLGFISRAGLNLRPFRLIRYTIGTLAAAALIVLMIQRHGGPPAALVFAPFNPDSLAAARNAQRPVVVDFSADWCVPCREMEYTTFIDPAVVRGASGYVLLRANLTARNSANDALIRRFDIEGVPTTVFIDSSGKIRKRRVGYLGPREFLQYLRQYD